MTKSKPKLRKLERPPTSSSESGLSESKTPSCASSPGNASATPHASPGSAGGSKALPSNWFISEIQQMMHGFGDVRKPLHDSAALIEEIVHQQMTALVYQAAESANLRNSRYLGLEDFLFLMRKDLVKLRRLLRYLELKDMKGGFKGAATMEDEETAEQGDGKTQPGRKRRKICYDFLSSIDQTGELLALFDDEGMDYIKRERQVRAEVQTRNMDAQQYLEFCEARQVNFGRKYKSQKFKDWLMQGIVMEVKPNPLAMEVISYLAYETVAQIVDLALLVRQDRKAKVSDPFLQLQPTVCVNHDFSLMMASPNPSVLSKTPLASVSPPMSPPSTPTPPTVAPAAGSAGTLSGGVGMNSTPASTPSAQKAKPKKRKKSGASNVLDLSLTDGITPADIREAMRRYTASTGPFARLSKVPCRSPKEVLLSC